MGKRKYLLFGDVTYWHLTWIWHAENILNLEVEIEGCEISNSEDCYNLYPEYVLKKEFGNDIFNRLCSQVDSLYKIGQGDVESRFDGEKGELEKMIYCNLNIPSDIQQRKIVKDKEIEASVKFQIDTIGQINFPEIIQVRNAQDEIFFRKEALRIVNNFSNFLPAQSKGKRINSFSYVSILFDEKLLKKYCRRDKKSKITNQP